MFPFLPFISLSRCGKCGGNSRRKNLNNSKRRTVYAIHDENHAGTSNEYFVASTYNISSMCKVECLSSVSSTQQVLSKKDVKVSHNDISYNNLNILKENLREKIKLPEMAVNQESDNNYNEINFSPFISKGRIKESFERSQIEELDEENSNSENQHFDNLLLDKNVTIENKDTNSVQISELVLTKKEVVKKKELSKSIKNNNINEHASFSSSELNIEVKPETEIQKDISMQDLLKSPQSPLTIDFPRILVQHQSMVTIELPFHLSTTMPDKQLSPTTTESRRASPSPSRSKSPKPLPATDTPPAIRAAKARQKAFQPSQAMLDLFGSEGKI